MEPRLPALSVNMRFCWPPVPEAATPLMLAGFPEAKDNPFGSVSSRPMVPSLADIANELLAPTVNEALFGLRNTGGLTTCKG